MKGYKFRVVIDVEEMVFRDILILENQTFEELHNAIIKAYNFQGGVMASFYISNDEWDKGEEIALMNMDDGTGRGPKTMGNTKISSMTEKVGQKLVYVYDFMRMWCFYVELTEILETKSDEQYPQTVLSYGDAPLEDAKEFDLGGMPSMDSDEEDIEDEIGGMFNDFEDDDY